MYKRQLEHNVNINLLTLEQNKLSIILQWYEEIQNKIDIISESADKDLDYCEEFEINVFILTKQISQVIHLLNKLQVDRLLRMSHVISLKCHKVVMYAIIVGNQVLLATALVNVQDEYGNYSIRRAVLDLSLIHI